MKIVFLCVAILVHAAFVACANQYTFLDPHYSPYHSSRSIYLNSRVINTEERMTLKFSGLHQPTHSLPDQFMVHLKPHGLNEIRNEIEQKIGSKLSYYLPHNTFLMVTTFENALDVEAIEGVLWVGKYAAEYKVEPALEAQAEDYLCTIDRTIGALHVVLAKDAVMDDNIGERLAQETGLHVVDENTHGLILQGPCSTTMNAVAHLREQREVHWIARAPQYKALNKYARGIVQSGNPSERPIWGRGITGTGQVVGCADTGLDTTLCFFNDANVTVVPNQVNMDARKVVMYQPIVDMEATAGDHGTHVVGSICGQAENASSPQAQYNGMAPGAKVAFQDIGRSDGSLSVPVDLNTGLFPKPYSEAQARIHSDSWGEDRNAYTAHAQQIDQFSWDHQDFLAVWAAGNSGTTGLFSVGAPATAKNCLTVGASQSSTSSFEEYMGLNYAGVERISPTTGPVFVAVPASFGPSFTRVQGQLMTPNPPMGCSTFEPGSANGKIALIARGDCNFDLKVRNAQAAGAIAVIVTNNVNGSPITMGASGDSGPTVTIPSVMVSLVNGNTMRTYASTDTIVIDMNLDSVNLTGDALYSLNNLASFSSQGPTADGRFKPDIVAPGQFIFSANSAGGVVGASKCSVKAMQGTSMATPVTAGSAALVRDYFSQGYYPSGTANVKAGFSASGSLVKAMMIHSAVDLSGGVATGSNLDPINPSVPLEGFGRIQLDNVLYFSDSTFKLYVENLQNVSTGQSQSYCYHVSADDQPFKVTLVWHDYPADLSALMDLVNDLNLMVLPPGGAPIVGNSAQRNGATLFDNINNVEVVSIQKPVIGTYTVVVIGASVPHGPQPYSIVVTGAIASTTCSEVSCPNSCSNHGTCTGAMCTCDAGYSGIDCSHVVPTFSINETLENEPVLSYQWKYFGFTVAASAMNHSLAIQFNRTSSVGDPDLYVKFGSLPSFSEYDYRNIDCDPCGTTTHSILIPQSQVRSGVYYLGMFGYCCDSATFDLAIISAMPCASPCLNGGSCNYNIGECICATGFFGSDCSDSGLPSYAAVLIAVAVFAFGAIVFLVLFCRARIRKICCCCKSSTQDDVALGQVLTPAIPQDVPMQPLVDQPEDTTPPGYAANSHL